MANKINDPSEPLDYRLGGETWDSFSLKYLQTIPYIFKVLNALNGTDDTGYVLPEPEGAGTLVRKNADGTVSISITGNAATATRATNADACTGNAATANKWKTPRTLTLTGNATGSVTFDGSGNVTMNVDVNGGNAATAAKLKTPRTITLTGAVTGTATFDGSGNVTIRTQGVSGNASSIINKPVDGANITDGTILVYRQGPNKFVMESKGTVGSGKTLKVLFGDEVLGQYNGDLAETIDLKPLIQEVMANVITQFERRNLLEIDEEGNLSPKASYDPLDIRALIDRCMLFTTDDEGNIIPKEGR